MLTHGQIAEYKRIHDESKRTRISTPQIAMLERAGKLELAKAWIKEIHKLNNSPHVGTDFNKIEVNRGKVRVGEKPWHDSRKHNAPISYVICNAVLRGYIVDEPYFTDRIPVLSLVPDPPDGGSVDTTTTDTTPGTPLDPDTFGTIIGGDTDTTTTTDTSANGQTDTSDDSPLTDSDGDDAPPIVTTPQPDLLSELHKLRDYCRSSGLADDGDDLSMGAIIQSRKMHLHGFPREAILHAATLTWNDSARSICDIPTYDPATYTNDDLDIPEGMHKLTAYVTDLCKLGIPVYLKGPSQSGKSTLAGHVAKVLDLPFGKVPLTGGASPAWLLGRDSRNGFLPSQFVCKYTDDESIVSHLTDSRFIVKSGVFLFDEVDAADPNMLLVVNDAISSDVLDHPYLGEITKGRNFIGIMAGNTFGLGATSSFGARQRLDGATLERTRMGRVVIDYDRDLERTIWQNMGE